MTCLITPNGDVFPCAFTQQEHFLAGNLRQENFQHIWEHGEVFNAFFRGKEGDACGACPAFEGCGGGCPAVKHALTGRLDVPDPDCVLETARAGIDSAPLCHG